MSYYYKYNFTSPELVYSVVKEELKSYFDTGAVDDLLFPTYVDKCLRKLGRSSYVISEEMMTIEDFESRLPDNFYAVREAWLCSEVKGPITQVPSAYYSQSDTQDTTLIGPITTDEVEDEHCCHHHDDEELLTYKTNYQESKSYKRQYLLKPGNISANKNCDVNYSNEWSFFSENPSGYAPGNADYDSFDIRDNKFITNFRTAVVYLVFYATAYDESENQLIPDNYRIREYIESFIKYKVFETLYNQVNDETYNQIEKKMMLYKQASDEAFILADIEVKKQTVYQKQRSIKNNLNRFQMYELPTRISRNSLSRNR